MWGVGPPPAGARRSGRACPRHLGAPALLPQAARPAPAALARVGERPALSPHGTPAPMLRLTCRLKLYLRRTHSRHPPRRQDEPCQDVVQVALPIQLDRHIHPSVTHGVTPSVGHGVNLNVINGLMRPIHCYASSWHATCRARVLYSFLVSSPAPAFASTPSSAVAKADASTVVVSIGPPPGPLISVRSLQSAGKRFST